MFPFLLLGTLSAHAKVSAALRAGAQIRSHDLSRPRYIRVLVGSHLRSRCGSTLVFKDIMP